MPPVTKPTQNSMMSLLRELLDDLCELAWLFVLNLSSSSDSDCGMSLLFEISEPWTEMMLEGHLLKTLSLISNGLAFSSIDMTF